jgi:hypothetical protein
MLSFCIYEMEKITRQLCNLPMEPVKAVLLGFPNTFF